MAIISKLRNSGVVIIVVIIALIIFVIGDILSGNKLSGLSQEDNAYGEVNGHLITQQEFSAEFTKYVNDILAMNPNYQFKPEDEKQIQEESWRKIIQRYTFEQEVEKAGIKITDADWGEILMGERANINIQQTPIFQDEKGKFSPDKVRQYLKQIKNQPAARKQFDMMRAQIAENIIQNWYPAYVAKCVYTTKAEKEYDYAMATRGVTGKVVAVGYGTIPDKDVKPTDADFQKYLDEHRETYKQKESRDIQYVVWDIVPSAADTATTIKLAEESRDRFTKMSANDTTGADVSPFLAIGEVPEEAATIMLSSNVGDVVGPLYKDGKYTVYKKVAEKPDTALYVHAAHILIPYSGSLPDGTQIKDTASALAKANEILAKVKSGGNFTELASKNGTDNTSTKGGDLGWKLPKEYVKEFADYVASNGKGSVGLVKTQFGYHIVKMLDDASNKRIRIATASFEVLPGAETLNAVTKASRKFRSLVVDGEKGSFDKAREKMGLTPRIMKDVLTSSKSIPGVQEAREVIVWLFDKSRKDNEISEVFSMPTRHVVVMVTNVKHEGYAEVDDVKEKIEPLVINKLKAKIIREKIEAAMASAKTPEDLAKKLNVAAIAIESFKLAQGTLPQIFNEPAVAGALFGVSEKKMSKPIEGNAVVAVVFVEKRDKVEAPKNANELNNPMEAYFRNPQFLSGRMFEALEKAANIKDNRYKYF